VPLVGDDWHCLQTGFDLWAHGLWRFLTPYPHVPVVRLTAIAPYAQASVSPGPPATVQRKAGSAWKTVRTVRTGVNGAWRLTVRVTRTTRWRAVARPAPGLALERSLVKRTVVTR
jgi:hypothetical protein